MRSYRQRNQTVLQSIDMENSFPANADKATGGEVQVSEPWFEEQISRAKELKAQKERDLAKYREIEKKREKSEEEWDFMVKYHHLTADD